MWLQAASSAAEAGRIVLPEHFWDGFGGAILGAIVGGLLAAGGGYLATRRIRRLDIKQAEDQDRREYQAAVTMVLDELRVNKEVAESLTQGSLVIEDPSAIGLTEGTYLRVQRSLALNLPTEIRVTVANAYQEIRARNTLFEPAELQAVPGGNVYPRKIRMQKLQFLLDQITRAIDTLEAERKKWA